MTQRTQNKIRLLVLFTVLAFAFLLSDCAYSAEGSWYKQWRATARGVPCDAAYVNSLPSEVRPYYTQISKAFPSNICMPIRFTEQLVVNGETVLGVCNLSFVVRRGASLSIEISRDYWNSFDSARREAVLLHEWLHCAHGVDHAPKSEFSIMAPTIPTSATFNELKAQYYHEAKVRMQATKLRGY